MPTIRPEDFTSNLFILLEETFESPPRDGNAYLDRRTGWFHTLASLSAETASQPVTPGGTSVAAQVAHTTFYLGALEGYMTGRLTGKVNWEASWRVQRVDEAGWRALKGELEAAYTRVKTLLKETRTWDDDRVGDALAILTHSAYHLGAVRQIARVVQTSS